MPDSGGRKALLQRARIIAIARDALVRGGLDRFVFREIAALAGMKVGNLQYYFKTREDLLEAVFRSDFDRVRVALLAGAAQTSIAGGGDDGAPDAGMLGELAAAFVSQWITDDRNVCIALSVLAAHEDRFAALYEELYQSFYADMAELLRPFAPQDSDEALLERARLIACVLDGACTQTRIPGPQTKREADNKLMDGVSALVIAIASGKGLPGSRSGRAAKSAPRTRATNKNTKTANKAGATRRTARK